ncbi:acyl-CoA dehydrogenase family protein [Nocardia carnea]|uniref:Acyl-CoA dehydrogenase family protein n=1 Tax=Nocardia carnea TaxID=37328 RepID=A0ABW7TK38_9NOCA|nr:acyl-CoA dehydrogenase family protein [Nocardia carnea]
MVDVADPQSLVQRARRIADDVLFPVAVQVDRTGTVPPEHWDLLAREGLYGLAAPGPDQLGFAEIVEVLEILAGGCLATTFVWMQHNGAVLSLAGSENTALRARYLDDLVHGRVRAGAAFAGVLAKAAKLHAEPVADGHLLNGEAPFVSGWGVVDVVQVSAVVPDGRGGTVVSGLVDATAGAGLTADPIDLAIGEATKTVRLRFADFLVTSDRTIAASPYSDFVGLQSFGSRLNGCVACGVAGRAIRLLREAGRVDAATALDQQLARARTELDAGLADSTRLPAARAGAADLAVRAAGALIAGTGARALLADNHAQCSLRDAVFTAVAGSRPEMRDILVNTMAAR